MPGWLITGAGGQLGSVLLKRLAERGEPATGTVSPTGPSPRFGASVPIDLLERARIAELIRSLAPRWIVHAAACTQVAVAARDPEHAERLNVEMTRTLAQLARDAGARFILVSTDMVFDGERAPYAHDHEPAPATVYGRTKRAAERATLAGDRDSGFAVVRVPLLYGLPAVDRRTTFRKQLETIRAGGPLRLFDDEVRTPLWLEDAADAVLRVAESDLGGVVHAAGPERLTRLDMGRKLVRALGVSEACLIPCSRQSAPDLEPRPRDLSLSSARFQLAFGTPPGRTMSAALDQFL